MVTHYICIYDDMVALVFDELGSMDCATLWTSDFPHPLLTVDKVGEKIVRVSLPRKRATPLFQCYGAVLSNVDNGNELDAQKLVGAVARSL